MFEIDLLKTNEDTALQSREILQTFVTSVNFRNFAELYIATIPSLAKDASLSNLAILLIFKALFSVMSTDFPKLVHKKVEKIVERSIVSKKKGKLLVKPQRQISEVSGSWIDLDHKNLQYQKAVN